MIEAGEERFELEKETIREAAEYVAKHTTVDGVPLLKAMPSVLDFMRANINLHEKDDVLKIFGIASYTGVSFNGKSELVQVWLRNLNAPYELSLIHI